MFPDMPLPVSSNCATAPWLPEEEVVGDFVTPFVLEQLFDHSCSVELAGSYLGHVPCKFRKVCLGFKYLPQINYRSCEGIDNINDKQMIQENDCFCYLINLLDNFYLEACYINHQLYILSLKSSLISLISFKYSFGAWYKNPAWRFALHCCCQDLLWFSFSLVVITESLQAPKSRVIRHCLLDS